MKKKLTCWRLYLPIPALSVLIIIAFFNCSGNKSLQKPGPIPDDRKYSIPQPEARDINPTAEYFKKQITDQLTQSFDLSRQLRNLSGNRKEAMNVNAFDEVENSSWFTNRNHREKMSIHEIVRGPNSTNGPDTSGTWIITRAKMQGVTPGFSIKDKQGEQFLIKFDPPGFSELVSGAEVISTKLFYAAGYNTPENYITYFHPKILKLGEKVKFTDEKGRKRFMKTDDLQAILDKIHIEPNGYIRALASKYIPGKLIGPFRYQGTRKDDPNDIFPHEHRRDLRGLYVLCAWLNHYDTKDGNTLDTYVTENGTSYVKHYLIDFGATLGSASCGPNHPWRGHENDFDPLAILKTFLSFGLYIKPHEKMEPVKYTSVGLYDRDYFTPQTYEPQVPNPAFENCTNLDGYWGAKIVMSFTDRQLKAVVQEGQLTNPEAEAELLDILFERRNRIGTYYFNQVAPLDNFKIVAKDNTRELHFSDIAVDTGLEPENKTIYRYQFGFNGVPVSSVKELGNRRIITFQTNELKKLFNHQRDGVSSNSIEWEVILTLKRAQKKQWSKCIRVFIRSDEDFKNLEIIGLKRQD